MKDTTKPNGIAFLSDMLKSTIKNGKSPIRPPMKKEPEADPLPTVEEIESAKETVEKLARVLRQLADARDASDSTSADVKVATAKRESLADAILAGNELPDCVGDVSAQARTLAITKATWQALNRLAEPGSLAINTLEVSRQHREKSRLHEAEAALRRTLTDAGLAPMALNQAISTAPALANLRKATAPLFSGNLLPLRLNTPVTANPKKRGKVMATGKPVKVFQDWRVNPLPSDCPSVAKRDPWNPRLIADSLDRLLAAHDASQALTE